MKTKEIIIDSIKKLLEKQKFENITVQDIIEKAGVSRATFYKYFSSKYDLAAALFSEYITQDILMKYDGNNFVDSLKPILEFIRNNQKYFRKVLKTTGEESFYGFLVKYYEEIYIRHGKERFEIEKFTDEQLFKISFAANQWAYCINKWVDSYCEPEPGTFAEWIYGVIITIEDILE